MYDDYDKTQRKLLAVCQLIFDCNGNSVCLKERSFFFFFSVEVKLIDLHCGGT